MDLMPFVLTRYHAASDGQTDWRTADKPQQHRARCRRSSSTYRSRQKSIGDLKVKVSSGTRNSTVYRLENWLLLDTQMEGWTCERCDSSREMHEKTAQCDGLVFDIFLSRIEVSNSRKTVLQSIIFVTRSSSEFTLRVVVSWSKKVKDQGQDMQQIWCTERTRIVHVCGMHVYLSNLKAPCWTYRAVAVGLYY